VEAIWEDWAACQDVKRNKELFSTQGFRKANDQLSSGCVRDGRVVGNSQVESVACVVRKVAKWQLFGECSFLQLHFRVAG
jgi:hypothetical protein